MSTQTPSQTVGPFFHFGLIFPDENNLLNEQTEGQRILIKGRLFDGDGDGIQDAIIETWQADAGGFYKHPADPNQAKADPNFSGFARAATGEAGLYRIKTIKPGAVRGKSKQQLAPHINVRVFARGMLMHAYTRLYFSDEAANAQDMVLNLPDVIDRKQTLVAKLQEGEGLSVYRFDIHLQGDQETVFFNP